MAYVAGCPCSGVKPLGCSGCGGTCGDVDSLGGDPLWPGTSSGRFAPSPTLSSTVRQSIPIFQSNPQFSGTSAARFAPSPGKAQLTPAQKALLDQQSLIDSTPRAAIWSGTDAERQSYGDQLLTNAAALYDPATLAKTFPGFTDAAGAAPLPGYNFPVYAAKVTAQTYKQPVVVVNNAALFPIPYDADPMKYQQTLIDAGGVRTLDIVYQDAVLPPTLDVPAGTVAKLVPAGGADFVAYFTPLGASATSRSRHPVRYTQPTTASNVLDRNKLHPFWGYLTGGTRVDVGKPITASGVLRKNELYPFQGYLTGGMNVPRGGPVSNRTPTTARAALGIDYLQPFQGYLSEGKPHRVAALGGIDLGGILGGVLGAVGGIFGGSAGSALGSAAGSIVGGLASSDAATTAALTYPQLASGVPTVSYADAQQALLLQQQQYQNQLAAQQLAFQQQQLQTAQTGGSFLSSITPLEWEIGGGALALVVLLTLMRK